MAIDNNDIERMKEIFVTRKECDKKMDETERQLSKYNTELALIKQTLSTISWVSKTTLGVVITALVGAILSLVLR